MERLRSVVRKAWAELPEAVLTSPMTTQNANQPSVRTCRNILPEILPRETAVNRWASLVKDPDRWDIDVPQELADEVFDLIARHAGLLEATAEMFTQLPQVAAEAELLLPDRNGEAFFKLAHRAARREQAGLPVDGEALEELLLAHFGYVAGSAEGPPRSLYAEMQNALADKAFRAILDELVEQGQTAPRAWQLRSFDENVWVAVMVELCLLLDHPTAPCLVDLDTEPPWDAVLDAGAHFWGLRASATVPQVVLGDRTPNTLPPPLDRTVAERLGSVLGRGTAGRDLRSAGRDVHELLLEAVARAAEPLGLAEPGSRSTVALAAMAANFLEPEEPEAATDRRGPAGAKKFGKTVSYCFGTARKQLRFYDPPPKKKTDDDPDDGGREEYLDDEYWAAKERYLVNRGYAHELRRLLANAPSLLVVAVWTIVQHREVMGTPLPDVEEATILVRNRALHVSKELCGAVLTQYATEQKRNRLPAHLGAVLRGLSVDDRRELALGGGPVPPGLQDRLRAANSAERERDPASEWVTVEQIRRLMRELGGNG